MVLRALGTIVKDYYVVEECFPYRASPRLKSPASVRGRMPANMALAGVVASKCSRFLPIRAYLDDPVAFLDCFCTGDSFQVFERCI